MKIDFSGNLLKVPQISAKDSAFPFQKIIKFPYHQNPDYQK